MSPEGGGPVVRRRRRGWVLVVDDRELDRRGTALALMEVLGEPSVAAAADLAEARGLVRRLTPDVVLLPARMCSPGSAQWAVWQEAVAPAHILLLGETADSNAVTLALRSGAAGYLLRDAPIAEIAGGVRAVADGSVHVSPPLTEQLLRALGRDDAGAEPLTERELEVLRLIAAGASNRDIADRLFISENTVKNHVRRILEKTGTRSRTGAVAHGVRQGLVSMG
jgi:two-component system NarL family response regulator